MATSSIAQPIQIRLTKKQVLIEKRLVFGLAAVVKDKEGYHIVDYDGDIINGEGLEQAVYAFVMDQHPDKPSGGYEHEQMEVARLVESFYITEAKLHALGIEKGHTITEGWWIGLKIIKDDVLEAVQQGKLNMFSIGGILTQSSAL